jgi:hypothetical protein
MRSAIGLFREDVRQTSLATKLQSQVAPLGIVMGAMNPTRNVGNMTPGQPEITWTNATGPQPPDRTTRLRAWNTHRIQARRFAWSALPSWRRRINVTFADDAPSHRLVA